MTEISSRSCQLLDDVIAFKLINMMSAACFIHNTIQMSHSLFMCICGESVFIVCLICIILYG